MNNELKQVHETIKRLHKRKDRTGVDRDLNEAYKLKRSLLDQQAEQESKFKKIQAGKVGAKVKSLHSEINELRVKLDALKKELGVQSSELMRLGITTVVPAKQKFIYLGKEACNLKAFRSHVEDNPSVFVRLEEVDHIEQVMREQMSAERLPGNFGHGALEISVSRDGYITDWSVPFYDEFSRVRVNICG